MWHRSRPVPPSGDERRKPWGGGATLRAMALAALLGASGLALPATALGAPSAPSSLTGPASGYLQGDTGGNYAKFQFDYPGDGSVVQLRLTTDNAAPLNTGAAGLVVYQNGSLLTSAGPDGPFADLAIFSSETPGPITVEVFNYDPANPVRFTLTPSGLASMPQAQPSNPVQTTTPAAIPLALNGNASGSLQGNGGGSFALYQLPYSGDGSPVTLTLTTDTSALLDSGAVGINVYQGGDLMASATQDGPLTATAIVTSSSATPLVVQVYNYDPTHTVTYTLSAQ